MRGFHRIHRTAFNLASTVPAFQTLSVYGCCRVDFHTQLADKANKSNTEDVQRLLGAVYNIMAPEGM